jgi:murein DD-endopeptidase MepM/ murein hydrolase activator NlpD
MIAHKINGEQYTTLYAHMLDDSIKVKVGQKIEAGTPLGKMGSTGMSTGKHLHWELHKGKKYEWSATGLNFIEPVAFFDALSKLEAIKGTAKNETPADAPTAPAPIHGKASQRTAPVPPKPAVTSGTYTVVRGDNLTRIASRNGTTVAELVRINEIKNANQINVGQVLKIK